MIIKVLKLAMLVLGVFLILNAIILSFTSNINAGNLLTLLTGMVLLFFSVEKIKNKIWAVIRVFAFFCICMAAVFMLFIFVYGCIDTVRYDEDVVIVLGAGIKGEQPTKALIERLDTAVEYINKNDKAYIMVTGGQGPQEDITEAEAMKRYLVNKGINQNKILCEDKSTSTSENFQFSKIILDEKLYNYSTAIITNNFHIYRAKQLAALNGLETTTMHADTPWFSAAVMYVREMFAIFKLWILKY